MQRFLEGPGFEKYVGDTENWLSLWSKMQETKPGDPPSEAKFSVAIYPKSDEEIRGGELHRRVRHRVDEFNNTRKSD